MTIAVSWWLISYVILWTVVLLLFVLLMALFRQIGVLSVRQRPLGAMPRDQRGPPVDAFLPAATVRTVGGSIVELGLRPMVLVYASETCSICHRLAPGINALSRRRELPTFVVVSIGEVEMSESYRRAIGDVSIVRSHELPPDYNVTSTPFAIGVASSGRVVLKGVINSLEQLEALTYGLLDSTSQGSVGATAHNTSHDRSPLSRN